MTTTYDFGDGNGPVAAHRHSNGGGWVADTAKVDETAYVGLNAMVFGNAEVSGNSRVSGNTFLV
jgi:serine acetyltransferase